jgi:hypothetical protein
MTTWTIEQLERETSLTQQLVDLKAPKSTAGFPTSWNQV